MDTDELVRRIKDASRSLRGKARGAAQDLEAIPDGQTGRVAIATSGMIFTVVADALDEIVKD